MTGCGLVRVALEQPLEAACLSGVLETGGDGRLMHYPVQRATCVREDEDPAKCASMVTLTDCLRAPISCC